MRHPWLTRAVLRDVFAIDALDGRIGRLATVQGGVVSREQAMALGATSRAIRVRREAGRWVDLHGGVYAVGHEAVSLRGRAIAALLYGPPGAVLSHQSAAALWGLRDDPLSVPHVSCERATSRATLCLHRAKLPAPHIHRRDGLPMTTPARTAFDLCEVLPYAEAARAVREARVAGLLRPSQLETLAASMPGRRAIPVARRILDGPAGEPTRSQTERLLLRHLAQAGIARPEVNAPVDRFLGDFVWRRQRLIVETDGWDTHRDRHSFEADRQRDAELGAAGWHVQRFTRLQVRDAPLRVVGTIATLLAVRDARLPRC